MTLNLQCSGGRKTADPNSFRACVHFTLVNIESGFKVNLSLNKKKKVSTAKVLGSRFRFYLPLVEMWIQYNSS